jgi:mannan endo-1,4-beta-mannosidase
VLNGRPYPVLGSNCYYLGYCPEPRMIDSVLDAAGAFSATALRIGAFMDLHQTGEGVPHGMFGACFQYFDHAENRIVQVDGEQGLRRLDRAVHLASARGYKLILVLTNSLPDFGGMDAYLRWLSPGAGDLRHDEFYDREDARAAYERWVRHLLERTNTETGIQYKNDPAIFAWELANEPRCASYQGMPGRSDCARSRRILRWIEHMSAFIKGIDPHHLVGVGDEGFFHRAFSCHHLYDGRHGVDCEAFLQVRDIDFGTYHLYPQGWGETSRGFGLRWIRQHAKVAAKVGKPMLLEEFGLVPGDSFVSGTAVRDDIYAEWVRAAAGAGGSLFWMLAGVEADGERFRSADKYCLFDAAEAPKMVAQARELQKTGGAILA